MAKVSMDLSELKAMEAQIELLDSMRKREATLNDDIKRLTEEKISALKENDKSVTIIRKVQNVDMIKTRLSAVQIIRKLSTTLHIDPNILVNKLSYRQHNLGSDDLEYDLNQISNLFFEKERTVTGDLEEGTITRRGLDEYIESLRGELKEELDDKVKEDLSSFSKLVKASTKYAEEKKAAKAYAKSQDRDIEKMSARLIEKDDSFDELKNKYNDLVKELTVTEETKTFTDDLKEIVVMSNIFNIRKNLLLGLSKIEKKVGTISLHKEIK